MRLLSIALMVSSSVLAQSAGFTSLMPKKDVQELWTIEVTPADSWRVEDGMVRCTGKPNGFLRSKKVYKNYVFRAEWRFQAEGWTGAPEKWPNAGFFINAGPLRDGWPMSQEVQGYFGEAGSLFGVRGGKITGAKRGDFVKDRPPLGSWDHYEITQRDGKVSVVLNGKLVNEGTDPVPSEGNVCLQSEGWPVDYRNVEIKVLDR
jgi:Domain of Unknown Function (DUF1080)